MWKILKINDDSYLVKHEYFEEKYNLHLTNLVNLWHEIIDKKCLLERFKDMNKLLEADDDEIFIDKIFQILYDDQAVKHLTIQEKSAKAILELKSKMGEFKFSFKFELALATPKFMFQEVTSNLLMKIHNLSTAQENLIDVIHRKDTEIEQYKLEGAVLARKLVETDKFVDKEFKEQFTKSLWPANIKNTFESIFDNYPEISQFVEKNLGIELKINEIINKPQISSDDKNSIQDIKKLSRKRRYPKSLIPPKITDKKQIKNSNKDQDMPPTQVKMEENVRLELRKKKAIRKIF